MKGILMSSTAEHMVLSLYVEALVSVSVRRRECVNLAVFTMDRDVGIIVINSYNKSYGTLINMTKINIKENGLRYKYHTIILPLLLIRTIFTYVQYWWPDSVRIVHVQLLLV